MQYTEKTFNIPELKGISAKSIEEHLKLYAGYVANTNKILEQIKTTDDAYVVGELRRRLGFEFDGMRNHEYYFASLEGGAQELSDGALKSALAEQYGSFDAWLEEFKAMAKTRGVGWAVLYKDGDNLLNAWIDEQQLGHLTGVKPVLMLDMWEHSFVGDYWPSGKGDYIEDFFKNLNWSVIEKNFEA
jgi:Fe-Mn family superoxide dismutase